MKRTLFLLSIITSCFIISCSDDDTINVNHKKCVVSNQNSRTYDEAYKLAQKAASFIDEKDDVNNSTKRKIKSSTNQDICSSVVKTSQDGKDTLMYIFNYENEKGFAIISAKNTTEGILAVTEDGNYIEGSAENDETGINLFLELAEKYIKENDMPNRLDPVPFFISDTLHNQVFNLVRVKWGQRHPEGHYCPNGISGCVITAIAQIMSYYEYPDSIELTYPGADMSVQHLDWDDIRSHILYYPVNGNESPLYCSASDSAHNALGRLCRQLGHLFGSTYNPTSTGTVSSTIKQDLIDLGYNCNTLTSYTSGTSKTYLDQNKPLYLCGRTAQDSGHGWVVDGYESLTIHSTYFDGTTENIFLLYNHVNWGWNGRNNGYFLDNVFDTTNYHSLDSSPYPPTASYNFEYNIRYYVPYV